MDIHSLKERLRYNKKRLALLTLGMVLIVSILLVVSRLDTLLVTPIPPSPSQRADVTSAQHLKFANPEDTAYPSSYSFEDPIIVPDTIRVYRILPGPDELFSNANLPAMAKAFGFNVDAQVTSITQGYMYYQEGNELAIIPTKGSIRFSSDLTTLPPFNIQDAGAQPHVIDSVRLVLSRARLDNPLINWQGAEVKMYELRNNSLEEVFSLGEKTFYHVTLPLRLNNLPLLSTEKQYVRVAPNGNVLGAFIWYPNLDISGVEEWKIIDYLSAVGRVRSNQGLFWESDTRALHEQITFTQTGLTYFLPNDFFSNPTGEFHILPAYMFTNNVDSVIVSALP